MSLNDFEASILVIVIVLFIATIAILICIIYLYIHFRRYKAVLHRLETNDSKRTSEMTAGRIASANQDPEANLKSTKTTKTILASQKSQQNKTVKLDSASRTMSPDQSKTKEKKVDKTIGLRNKDKFPTISQAQSEKSCSADISMDNFVGKEMNKGVFKQYKIAKPRSKESQKVAAPKVKQKPKSPDKLKDNQEPAPLEDAPTQSMTLQTQLETVNKSAELKLPVSPTTTTVLKAEKEKESKSSNLTASSDIRLKIVAGGSGNPASQKAKSIEEPSTADKNIAVVKSDRANEKSVKELKPVTRTRKKRTSSKPRVKPRSRSRSRRKSKTRSKEAPF